MNKNRWRRCGVFYFAFVFTLVPALASAYIDPSVTTYAIQAIAGVAVAAGAFFATYGRRMKKSWMKTVGVDGNEAAAEEAPLEVTREDLRADLAAKRESRQAAPAAKKHKSIKGRIITSTYNASIYLHWKGQDGIYRRFKESQWSAPVPNPDERSSSRRHLF